MGFKPGIEATVTGDSMGVLYTGTALVLTAADTGKIYTLFNGDNAAVTITLPVIADGPPLAGTTYQFFIAEPTTSGYTFNVGTPGDSVAFKGSLMMGCATKDQEANGVVVACGDDIDRIVLKSGETNGAGASGSMMRLTCIVSETYAIWGVEGCVLTADVDSTGAAIFVDTT